ncbi:MAG: SIS domain-containing protein [Clostridia bacterium]|nr:SIS domain-containing protein [Clostridia bacterium]
MSEKFVSREQVELLHRRIKFAEQTDASKELYADLLFRKKDHILVVGAGGSYPAAIFAKYALSGQFYCTTDVATPQTAINMIHHNSYDVIIGISYSGKTPDIKATAITALYEGSHFVLITGAQKEVVSDFYDNDKRITIISYYDPLEGTGKERGMISMASTLIPCIVFDDWGERKLIHENQMALFSAQNFVGNLNISKIANCIKKSPIIHVFYEWDTHATAADIESKFTESGVAHVILHEKKNFSHGRYTSLYKQDFALAINLTRYSVGSSSEHKFYRNDYDKVLAEFLENLCNTKDSFYLEFGSACVGPAQWNIEALTKLPYLITSIGEELGIDISKPLKPFPGEATKLYDYKGKF